MTHSPSSLDKEMLDRWWETSRSRELYPIIGLASSMIVTNGQIGDALTDFLNEL